MKRLLLAGGGHGNLAVLRALARRPLPQVDIVLITLADKFLYSGMVPGWMAGHYPLEKCQIDLQPLALKAGVRLILEKVAAIDATQQRVVLSDSRYLEYDLLSLDIGSETDISRLDTYDGTLVPVRPLERLVKDWSAFLGEAQCGGELNLVVVGGGAAGTELAFAAQYAVAASAPRVSVTLVVPAQGLLPLHAAGFRERAQQCLLERGIRIVCGMAAGAPGGLQMDPGKLLSADIVLAATGAQSPAWLRLTGLALDTAGFVSVGPTHASVSHGNVFAVGDICSRRDLHLAKSGVHAVHAGSVLARNLIAMLEGACLEQYHPRKHSLYLLATRPGHALMSWGSLSASGRWVWNWKNHIDEGFIARNDYSAL